MGKAKDARAIARAAEQAKADRLELDAAEDRGRRTALQDMVSWVQAKYMSDDVEIHSAEGKALRRIAEELTEHFAQRIENVSEGEE